MSILVERPGLQTTVQAGPRTGLRYLGVPASGAADALALALANRLVGNPPFAAGLEVTFDGPTLVFDTPATVALTGADCELTLNACTCPAHEVIRVRTGDRLAIGASRTGVRAYLAIAGGLLVSAVLGSASTYLPAGLGGHRGRALAAGDTLDTVTGPRTPQDCRTPDAYRPMLTHAWALRVCPGADRESATRDALSALTSTNWTVGRRADRMGLELEGPLLGVTTGGRMPSAATFPGTLQCPESGVPFLLGIDAQTTGGYPRLLQVNRSDRHLIGQLRPGDRLRLLLRTPAQAAEELREKHEAWRRWLPDIAAII